MYQGIVVARQSVGWWILALQLPCCPEVSGDPWMEIEAWNLQDPE